MKSETNTNRTDAKFVERTESKGALGQSGLNEEVSGEALRRIFAEDSFLFAEQLNEFPSLVIRDLRFQKL